MKHYIICKFTDEAKENNHLVSSIKELYEKATAVEGIKKVEFVQNCIDRPNRYDLMIILYIEKEKLPVWDSSDIHKKWKAEFGGCLAAKAIFDAEE